MQPARDLLHRVPLREAAHIADLGCGAGAVTALLRERHPAATITGVDADAAMLAAAAERGLSGVTWVQADLAKWRPAVPVQLLVANAALHWVHGHAQLLPALLRALTPGGVFAMQVPVLAETPLQAAIDDAVTASAWSGVLTAARAATEVRSLPAYDEILTPHASEVLLWETLYVHRLPDAAAILDWAKGSRLRPYFAALEQAGHDPAVFERALLAELAAHFPATASGEVLLPFPRRFVVAIR